MFDDEMRHFGKQSNWNFSFNSLSNTTKSEIKFFFHSHSNNLNSIIRFFLLKHDKYRCSAFNTSDADAEESIETTNKIFLRQQNVSLSFHRDHSNY